MSDNDKDTTAVTEGAENAVEGAEVPGEVNLQENKKTTTGGAKKGNVGVYTHKFRKPFEYENTKYTTMTFDFEKLTGRDMINIENEMQANNEYALDPLVSRNFQSKMASKAAGIGNDALEAMPLVEFNRITNATRSFLIDSGY